MSGNQARAEHTASVVSLLIRLVVGVVLLFAGIGKWINILGGAVSYGAFIQGFVDAINESWAYNWPFRALIYVFAAILPWAETGLGLTICLGFKTRTVLVVAAVAEDGLRDEAPASALRLPGLRPSGA